MVKGDSQLVINQMMKEYQSLDPRMTAYLTEVRRLERYFHRLEAKHVSQKEYTIADELSRIASSWQSLPIGMFSEWLNKPSAEVLDLGPRALRRSGLIVDGPYCLILTVNSSHYFNKRNQPT